VRRPARGLAGAARDAGDPRPPSVRRTPPAAPAHPHLVGGARAAAIEHDGEVFARCRALVRRRIEPADAAPQPGFERVTTLSE
jgi:hypothetical protein